MKESTYKATALDVSAAKRDVGGGPLWPNGKRFAFTIVDDTDQSTVDNTKPVYDFLMDLGFRTTKTVWPLSAQGTPVSGGDSLQCHRYRAWILELRGCGFEIASHGAADGSSPREVTSEGLEYFRQIIGQYPSIHTCHLGQREALYWGDGRLDPPASWVYRCLRRGHSAQLYTGANRSSPYFWGDLAHQIGAKYVRNFVFDDINTLKMDPLMPYYDHRRPYARAWFSSSYGSGVSAFCRLLSEKNQDRLVEEGGACIVYTHFGSSFWPISKRVDSLMRRLSGLPGWFVPATTLLDHLAGRRGFVSTCERNLEYQMMQWNWLLRQALRKIGP